METSTRIIDYHLKERIEGENSKTTLSGSNIEVEGKKQGQKWPCFFPETSGDSHRAK